MTWCPTREEYQKFDRLDACRKCVLSFSDQKLFPWGEEGGVGNGGMEKRGQGLIRYVSRGLSFSSAVPTHSAFFFAPQLIRAMDPSQCVV